MFESTATRPILKALQIGMSCCKTGDRDEPPASVCYGIRAESKRVVYLGDGVVEPVRDADHGTGPSRRSNEFGGAAVELRSTCYSTGSSRSSDRRCCNRG
jgi:hypothetical protein